MNILLDLDGTLIDTAHDKYKSMKDGVSETLLSEIKISNDAKEFVKYQTNIGNTVIIVSDSHPRYVNKFATLFNIQCISLCDKPNTTKLLSFISQNKTLNQNFLNDKTNFIIVGDTWLDIELGRKLNIPTVLVEFFKTTSTESRDSLGDRYKHIKMGATFYAKTFHKLTEIINDKERYLLSLEGIFHNPPINSFEAVDLKTEKYLDTYTFIRSLGRQQQGECDIYAQAKQYFQISNKNRSPEFLQTLAKGVENYIAHVRSIEKFNHWDMITYVSDKQTTKPANKMQEIFNTIKVDIQKEQIFEWVNNVDGSLRDRPTIGERKNFIAKFIYTKNEIDIGGKNIIIIDDQITTSATAEVLIADLRKKSAKNILFIALFNLITNVPNEKKCPKCGKNMVTKIIRETGVKFLSCVPPKYKGNGCGYTENIDE